MQPRQRVVVIGGGFGGLNAVRALRRASVHVTLVDRRNFHLFQPLLYQVATGGLSPANISAPLRRIFRRQQNVDVVLAKAVDFDVANRKVILADGELAYDSLIVATGSRHSYFGRDEWESLAPGLKTIEDATAIRSRILSAFEAAERETDAEARSRLLTFVIVGAGPTGVELAGALAEVSRHTLKSEFRNIDPGQAKILLIDAAERVLPVYPEKLSQKATRSLERLGVTVQTRSLVVEVQPDYAVIETGGLRTTVATRTVLWAAGVQASSLGKALAKATAATTDRSGRINVERDLSIPGHPEVFVIGDLARFVDEQGKPLPGVAPVAIQQGKYVGQLIDRRLRGLSCSPFHFKELGNMATVGRSTAVADFGRVQLNGFVAWVLWLVVHLMQLIQFESRLLVLIQWAWNYFTFNRNARLITGNSPANVAFVPLNNEVKQKDADEKS